MSKGIVVKRRHTLVRALALVAAASIPGAALADHQQVAQAHEHGEHATPSTGDKAGMSDASKAYEEAMEKMHKGMSIPYANDVDVDFVRGMIPHHQGAIDQAEVLLKYSKNLRLRRLAGGIIAAQRREIRFMVKWLKEHDQGIESSEMPAWMKNAPSTSEEATKSGAQD